MLHLYCSGLAEHYQGGQEIVYYHSRADLHDKIEYYLGEPEERRRIAANGLARTLAVHTYTDRCRELIRVVQERI